MRLYKSVFAKTAMIVALAAVGVPGGANAQGAGQGKASRAVTATPLARNGSAAPPTYDQSGLTQFSTRSPSPPVAPSTGNRGTGAPAMRGRR
jgi:hypothetical protein